MEKGGEEGGEGEGRGMGWEKGVKLLGYCYSLNFIVETSRRS